MEGCRDMKFNVIYMTLYYSLPYIMLLTLRITINFSTTAKRTAQFNTIQHKHNTIERPEFEMNVF